MTYSYFQSSGDARDYLESLANCEVVALDTEFIRTRTFYPIPALYQLNAGGDIALIDATDKGDWSAFIGVLQSETQVKAMHACGEDLEVFSRHFALKPVNLFDTQVANAFVSDVFSISYARLVNNLLGVELDKHETRSDWLQRPLGENQLEYASDDVYYLLDLYHELRNKLISLGRLEWFMEEMQRLLNPSVITPENFFRSVKRSNNLSPQGLSKLQALCLWRENQARLDDVPRGRVVKDEQLVAIAALADPDSTEIVRTLDFRTNRKYGKSIVDAFEAGRSVPVDQYPEPAEAPLTKKQGDLVKQLKQFATTRAVELNMAPELLGRKRDIEATIRRFLKSGILADVHTGWRMDIVGEEFLNIMKRTLQ